jgi:3-deoxy-D-manno-octulosonic-acid transferase
MGQLAELYSIGDLAYVGGAMHAKIHNVLEPAAHGLALSSGPFYKNSREAIRFQKDGILTVVENAAQMTSWWTESARQVSDIRKSIHSKVYELCGASDKLFSALEELLNGQTFMARPGMSEHA